MNKIILTNIQRGSLHDGPGVRVTYFFQGCNLKCGWCHNPETLALRPTLMKYTDKCISCGLCIKACPQNEESGNCLNCGRCVDVCPTGARTLSGKEYDPDVLLKIAIRESHFISENGGITCSGGEPMLQIDALTELLCLFKENKIHTAVDTAANVPWERFEKIMPYTDLFLVDYKLSDDPSHKKHTGVSRRLISSNLKRLAKCSKDVWIRMPIIPGVNDNIAHIDRAGCELSEIGFCGLIELLPFHRLGGAKYTALGQKYDYANTLPPSKESLTLFKERLLSFGLNVKI